jgi:NADPH2:quinone reductase
MKSYWMKSDGRVADIELREVEQPKPGPGQILIRVRASGLNRGEFILGHGLHKTGDAKAIGMDAAGEVVACGEGVAGFSVGDRVFGRCPGAFSEFALMDQKEIMAMPASLSWEQAAAIPLTFHVVFDMLVIQGHLKAGEWVFIPGVSSGVGVSALLMAKALGAKVIGTSGSQEKLDRLRGLGLDLGICTRAPNFYDQVMDATNRKGVDLVINTVGGSVFAECIRCMAFQGRLATVGYVDGVLKAEIDIEALHSKRLTLFGVSNKLRTQLQRSESVPAFREQMLPLFAAKRIVPLVDQVFPFGQLVEAKAAMEANQHLGKIVLAGTASGN